MRSNSSVLAYLVVASGAVSRVEVDILNYVVATWNLADKTLRAVVRRVGPPATRWWFCLVREHSHLNTHLEGERSGGEHVALFVCSLVLKGRFVLRGDGKREEMGIH